MKLLEYTTQNAGVDLASSGNDQQLAQRFKLYRAAPIGRISLYLKKTGSPAGYLVVDLQYTSSDNPSGSVIGSCTSTPVIISTGVTGSYAWVDFDIAEAAREIISPLTSYHMVLRSSGYTYADGTTEIIWGCDQTSPIYLDGEGETYSGSVWSNLSTDTDFCFKLYSRNRSVYTSLSEVEALTRHLTDAGKYGTETIPSVLSVMDFEEDTCNEVDSWLEGAGFTTPLTDTTSISLIRSYANFGVAMRCELTQRTSGFSAGETDTRAGAFRSQYYYLRDELQAGGALVDMLINVGEERSTTSALSAGLTAGHIEEDERDDYRDDDDLISPVFQTDMWDNN
jgi:hypothetical protein